MGDLALTIPRLPAMSKAAIDLVRRMEEVTGTLPQVVVDTQHVLHAGLYSRTIRLAMGTMITGALVKIATLVIVEGDCRVWLDGESQRLTGYNVLPASAGRKQAFLALASTHITMIFPTKADTVEQAEREFTDDADRLASRRDDARNQTIVTGE